MSAQMDEPLLFVGQLGVHRHEILKCCANHNEYRSILLCVYGKTVQAIQSRIARSARSLALPKNRYATLRMRNGSAVGRRFAVAVETIQHRDNIG